MVSLPPWLPPAILNRYIVTLKIYVFDVDFPLASTIITCSFGKKSAVNNYRFFFSFFFHVFNNNLKISAHQFWVVSFEFRFCKLSHQLTIVCFIIIKMSPLRLGRRIGLPSQFVLHFSPQSFISITFKSINLSSLNFMSVFLYIFKDHHQFFVSIFNTGTLSINKVTNCGL